MSAIVTLTMDPALEITTSTPKVELMHKLRCTPARFDPGGGGDQCRAHDRQARWS